MAGFIAGARVLSRDHAARGRRRRRASRSRDARRRSPACPARVRRDRRRRASPPASFRPVDPVFAYFTHARADRVLSAPARRFAKRSLHLHVVDLRALSPDDFVRHLQESVRRSLRARRGAAARHDEADTMMRLPRRPAAAQRGSARGRSRRPARARRSRRPTASACPARSRRPTCRWPRRSADACSSCASTRAIASRPAISSRGSTRSTRSSRSPARRAEREQADAQLRLLARRRARRRHPPGRSAARRPPTRTCAPSKWNSPPRRPTSIASKRSSRRTPARASSATMR